MAEEVQKTKRPPYEPKTDDELKELALALLDNQVFTDKHIPEEFRDQITLDRIFLNLAFTDPRAGLASWFKEQNITMVYEFMQESGPRGFSIGGSPTFPNFFSCKFLNHSDQKRLAEIMKRLVDALSDPGEEDSSEAPA